LKFDQLKKVNNTHRTPGAAIWVSTVLEIAATLYGDAFAMLSTGSAVFLYVSYVMPVAAGLNDEDKTWVRAYGRDLQGHRRSRAR